MYVNLIGGFSFSQFNYMKLETYTKNFDTNTFFIFEGSLHHKFHNSVREQMWCSNLNENMTKPTSPDHYKTYLV